MRLYWEMAASRRGSAGRGGRWVGTQLNGCDNSKHWCRLNDLLGVQSGRSPGNAIPRTTLLQSTKALIKPINFIVSRHRNQLPAIGFLELQKDGFGEDKIPAFPTFPAFLFINTQNVCPYTNKALVLSHLDYGNTTLAGIPSYQLKRL